MTYIDCGVALLRREIVEAIPENQPFDLAEPLLRPLNGCPSRFPF